MSTLVHSRVGVLFGGPSPEHDVSILTGLQAARALVRAGTAHVEALYWTKGEQFVAVDPRSEASAFLDGPPHGFRELRFIAQPGGGFLTVKGGVLGALGGGKERKLDLDVIVNCCHGGPGEDGTIQGALDLAGLPYTGPTAAAAALGMDKLAFGGVVRSAGLPALPRTLVVPGGDPPEWAEPGTPFILKPRFGGSSIGIEVVAEWPDVLRYVGLGGPHTLRGVVAEPYNGDAYDVEVGVRVYPAFSLSLFARALRGAGPGKILSYRDKYLGGEGMVSAPRELPARLPEGLEKELVGAATVIASLVGARGVWRIDFLVDDPSGQWWVNEVNTVPGSLAKYLWSGEAAVDFAVLLGDMIEEARSHPGARWAAAGADGTALRSAASIASKLG